MLRLSYGIGLILVALAIHRPLLAASPSHMQARTIRVAGSEGRTLQTLALLPDGKIAALVAPSRHGEIPGSESAKSSEVHLFDAEGKELETWPVEFRAQSIGTGPDGSVFVGGDGQLARFSSAGKLLETIELPHLKKVLGDADALREQAVEMQKQYEKSIGESTKQFDDQKKQIEEKLEELKKKDEKDLTNSEKRRIKRYEEQIKQLGSISLQIKVPSVEQLMKQLTDRLRIINGVSVTDKDVFVVTGESAGFGYAVWRMDHSFQEAKQVLSGLRGCCGQMDVQAHGDELFVAENCNHRVGRYNRDGEKIMAFGQRGEQPEGPGLLKTLLGGKKAKAEEEKPSAGFGGCCNPMNCRVGNDGLVYTSESEGHIRCFTPEGEYRGLVGSCKLTGGCKNVAVAVSPDSSKVYFCDQPGQQIIVLARDSSAEKEADQGDTPEKKAPGKDADEAKANETKSAVKKSDE